MKNPLVREDLVNFSTASNLAFNQKVKDLIRSGHNIYHFAFGQSPFPVPDCMTNALKEFTHKKEYVSMGGIPELTDEIIRFHRHYDGVELSSENLVVGPGSKELIFLIMLTFNGDILLPSPAWATYAPQILLAGKKCYTIPTHKEQGWKLTPKLLMDTLQDPTLKKNKLLIFTNPGNPTGTCYTADEQKELSVVCREHNILIVSDEIYGRLTFNRNHCTMVKHYPEGTILTSGFSKWASMGGWRLGYAHVPEELRPLLEAVKSAASQTYSCASTPIQYAVAMAMKENGDELKTYMDNCSRILKAVGEYCSRELSSVGVTGRPSEAGYYYMPDFEVIREALAKRGITDGPGMTSAMLKEANVALMPSNDFLLPNSELITRFCFVCFDGGNALKALQGHDSTSNIVIDDDFLIKYCLPIINGVSNIKEWVLKQLEI